MRNNQKTNPSKRRFAGRPQSPDPLNGLAEALPLGLHQYQLHSNGDLIFTGGNPAADRILGIDHTLHIGKSIEAAFPNLVQTDIPQAYRRIAQSGGSFEREFITYQDGGVKGIFKVHAFQTGRDCMAALFQDTRDAEQTKQALFESEERYRTLVEHSPDTIAVHSDGKLVYVNPAGLRQLGVDHAEQVLGLPVMDLLPPETRQLNLEMLAGVAQGKTYPPLEQTILRPDGSTVEVEMICAPVLFQGKPAFQLIIRDITAQKLARQAVRESEQQLRSLVEAAPLGLHRYELRPDGQLIFIGANPAADRILGIDHQTLVGLPIQDAFPTHRQTPIPALYSQVAREGTPYTSEEVAYQDNQVQGVFEIHAFQSGPSRMAVFFQEITAKKKGLIELRESEEKFRTLIEQNSEGVLLCDEQGLIIEWNAAQEHSSGIPREQALGRPVWDLQFQVTSPEHKNIAFYENLKEKGLRMLQTGQSPIFYHPLEIAMHRPDGTQAFILQTAFPIKTHAGYRIGSVMRDITQGKQAQLELERRTVELEALHAVALAGTEAVSTDDLLERLAEIFHEKLYPDHFGVAFLDEQTRSLSYHPTFTQKNWVFGTELPLDRGIGGAVARSGIARRVVDVRLDPDYVEADPDTRSELCAPILIGGKVIGVINLESARVGNFTQADERLATAIAGELGMGLEKIRLLEAEQSRRKELEALEQISAVLRSEEEPGGVLQAVLERVMAVLNLRGAGIVLRESQTGELAARAGLGGWTLAPGFRIPPGDGISQQVAATQHYYLQNDVSRDPRLQFANHLIPVQSFLCLALVVDGHTQGLLYLGRDPGFVRSDVHLAIAVADVLGSMLHQVDLHEQTQRQVDRLMALRAIDQSILSGLDLEQTLAVLLEKITGLLQVDAANILLYQPTSKTLKTAAERGLPLEPIWNVSQVLKDTHAGRVALNRQMEFIPDLNQLDDYLPKKIRELGENFTSYVAMPLVAKAELKGVLQIFTHTRLEPSPDWMGFLEALADQAAIAVDNALLVQSLKQTNQALIDSYDKTIEGWARALDLRDKETQGHSRRVTELTEQLGKRLGIPEEDWVYLRWGALLHDIGKVGVPDEILLKPGPLSEDEWKVMRKHPLYAADLLYPIDFLRQAIEIPYGHHEKWDGTGYPQGLQGEEIPFSARIFAIVDVWDALTHDRPYRLAWTKEEAMAYLQEQSGKHFDPQVVAGFLALMQAASQ